MTTPSQEPTNRRVFSREELTDLLAIADRFPEEYDTKTNCRPPVYPNVVQVEGPRPARRRPPPLPRAQSSKLAAATGRPVFPVTPPARRGRPPRRAMTEGREAG